MRSRPPVQADDNIARTAAAERDIYLAFLPLSPALRADLIDIIYTLQQQQKEQAEQQLAQAQAQLQDRQRRLANAGSIAEGRALAERRV